MAKPNNGNTEVVIINLYTNLIKNKNIDNLVINFNKNIYNLVINFNKNIDNLVINFNKNIYNLVITKILNRW